MNRSTRNIVGWSLAALVSAGAAIGLTSCAKKLDGKTAEEWAELAQQEFCAGNFGLALDYYKNAEDVETGDQYKAELKATRQRIKELSTPRPNLELLARFTNAKKQGDHYILIAGATERRYGLTGTAMEIYAINSGLEYSTIDFTDPSVIREVTRTATEIEYANPQLEQRRLRERGDSYHVNAGEGYNVPTTLVHPPQ